MVQQMVAKHLHRFKQPWMERDVANLLLRNDIRRMQASTYVGLHIRRGDKLKIEAHPVPVEVRLRMLRSKPTDTLLRSCVAVA